MTPDEALEIWQSEQPRRPGELTVAAVAEVRLKT